MNRSTLWLHFSLGKHSSSSFCFSCSPAVCVLVVMLCSLHVYADWLYVSRALFFLQVIVIICRAGGWRLFCSVRRSGCHLTMCVLAQWISIIIFHSIPSKVELIVTRNEDKWETGGVTIELPGRNKHRAEEYIILFMISVFCDLSGDEREQILCVRDGVNNRVPDYPF